LGHRADAATGRAAVRRLGRDIQAPVGAELLAARRADKRVLAYRKNLLRTQAAEAFARDAAVSWAEYDEPQQVARLVQMALIETILAYGPARGLPRSSKARCAAFWSNSGAAKGRYLAWKRKAARAAVA
jgi:hypothetical protein